MSLNFPPIYLLSTNLQPEELHSLEESIPSLTWDAREAEVVLGKITRRERALFELRRLKVKTEEVSAPPQPIDEGDEQPWKRLRTSGSELSGGRSSLDGRRQQRLDEAQLTTSPPGIVKVVRLSWMTDSLKQGVVLPTKGYLLYEGAKLPATEEPSTQKPVSMSECPTGGPTSSIQKRTPEPARPSASSRSHRPQSRSSSVQPPALLRETTSEHHSPLPPVPNFLHTSYSCQRPTPVNTPNASFIDELKEIRTQRLLEGDQVGVRAYSTSIAVLAAYPHRLQRSSGQSPEQVNLAHA